MRVGLLVGCVVSIWILGFASQSAAAEETPVFTPPDDGYDWLPLADGQIPEQDDFRLLVGLSYEF